MWKQINKYKICQNSKTCRASEALHHYNRPQNVLCNCIVVMSVLYMWALLFMLSDIHHWPSRTVCGLFETLYSDMHRWSNCSTCHVLTCRAVPVGHWVIFI